MTDLVLRLLRECALNLVVRSFTTSHRFYVQPPPDSSHCCEGIKLWSQTVWTYSQLTPRLAPMTKKESSGEVGFGHSVPNTDEHDIMENG